MEQNSTSSGNNKSNPAFGFKSFNTEKLCFSMAFSYSARNSGKAGLTER
jgi:hypothetical protein